MKSLSRRQFLGHAAAGAAVGGLALGAGCRPAASTGPNVYVPGQNFEFKMVTSWPPNMPLIGEGANLVAKWCEELSQGRLKVKVYGGGELVGPLETFQAVSTGQVEMSHTAAYYQAGRVPATQLLTSVPFGMAAQQMNAWFYAGDGIKLYSELYAEHNLVPMPAGNTGVQMAGWYNKEINTASDLKGLKIRAAGLGGKILTGLGSSCILLPGGELYTSLERGVIDALEWVGPHHDMLMGFHKIAKYYYYPGWAEPTGVLELAVNKTAYEKLPPDLQAIIQAAAARANQWMLSEFESKNNAALVSLVRDFKVQLKRVPDEVIKVCQTQSIEVIGDACAKDPWTQKLWESYRKFQKDLNGWTEIADRAYYNMLADLAAQRG